MGEHTKIEWCDHTFSPWWGCVKVSEACKFCYAEGVGDRFGKNLWGPKHDIRVFGDKRWNELGRWNRKAERAGERRRVFCMSMGDLLEGRGKLGQETWDAMVAARARLWKIIEETPWLDYLLLTKRPENILEMVPRTWLVPETPIVDGTVAPHGWPSNVMTLTTVEDQASADARIPELLKVPGPHGLSMEPLRGHVDLTARTGEEFINGGTGDSWRAPLWSCTECGGSRYSQTEPQAFECGACRGTGIGIDWVIAGGESGPRARPSHPDWFRSLRDQCADAGVPFFFKQHGAWATGDDIDDAGLAHPGFSEEHASDGGVPRRHWRGDQLIPHHLGKNTDTTVYRIGKHDAGAYLDGVEHKAFPA